MKIRNFSIVLGLSLCMLYNCSENNVDVVTNSNPNTSNTDNASQQPDVIESGSLSESSVSEPVKNDEVQSKQVKTDAEVILEGIQFALGKGVDAIQKQRIRDSINALYKQKFFAYQIGIKQGKEEAYKSYNKLLQKGVQSIYVFKAGRREYYLVKYQAMTEQELNENKDAFKTELGEIANEGVDVINLSGFCNKKETVTKITKSEDDVEIKCLECDK